MKIKPLYIYLIGFVFFVAAVIFFSSKSSESKMPNDAAHSHASSDNPHSGMGMGQDDPNAPSKDNVSEKYKQEFERRKSEYEKNPNDTLKMREYAEILYQSHKYNPALDLLEKILKVNPNRKDVLLAETVIYDIQGDVTKAEEVTNKILSFRKNDPEASFNLGIIMEKKGDKEKAKQIWNDIYKRSPESAIGKMAKDQVDRLNEPSK